MRYINPHCNHLKIIGPPIRFLSKIFIFGCTAQKIIEIAKNIRYIGTAITQNIKVSAVFIIFIILNFIIFIFLQFELILRFFSPYIH